MNLSIEIRYRQNAGYVHRCIFQSQKKYTKNRGFVLSSLVRKMGAVEATEKPRNLPYPQLFIMSVSLQHYFWM